MGRKIFFEDLRKGELHEKKIKKTIQKHLGIKLKKLKSFSVFDMYNKNEKVLVEIKRRYCNSTKYETTMIGYNKIEYLKNKYPNWKGYFFITFNDGSYCCCLNDIDYNVSYSGTYNKGFKDYKNHAFINMNEFTKIKI